MKKIDRPLILLLGPSGSGKSTVAQALCAQYGLKVVQSFTSRPPRSPNETGHTFVSRELMVELLIANRFIAYTYINNHHYGATQEQLDESDLYIVDAAGAKDVWLKYDTQRPRYLIVLDISDSERINRMKQRPGGAQELQGRADFDAKATKQNVALMSSFPHSIYIINNDLEQTIRDIAAFCHLEGR